MRAYSYFTILLGAFNNMGPIKWGDREFPIAKITKYNEVAEDWQKKARECEGYCN